MRWIRCGAAKQLLMLLIALMGMPVMAAEPGQACRVFDDCIRQIEASRVGTSPAAQTQEQIALSHQLLQLDDAVPRLVEMLGDADIGKATIAAAALRDANAIDPRYLPAIERGLDRGLPWLVAALGRIPSDEAARRAVDELMRSPDAPLDQASYAVELSGKRAIPYIIDIAHCRSGCQSGQAYKLGEVLGRMGPEAMSAIPSLVGIAGDPWVPQATAGEAIATLANMGPVAQSAGPALIALRSHRLALAQGIDAALIAIHSPAAGAIVGRVLAAHGADYTSLRRLGLLGPAGYDAGPEVLKILLREEGELQVSAAQALGLIGYRPAVPALIDALKNEANVRLNGAAAESLGRLGDASARPALQWAAQAHWFPPVRARAAEALSHLSSGVPYAPLGRDDEFGFVSAHIFAREQRQSSTCSASRTLTGSPSKMPVPGGDLVVVDNGEWGASLSFQPAGGQDQMILEQRITSLQRFHGQIVAVVAIDSYLISSGGLYMIKRSDDGVWHASLWRMLPWSPQGARLQRNGELLVALGGGYDVLVDGKGNMRVPDCAATSTRI
ncbi:MULTISPECIES: HEAT repeat domain-containing protein [Dyella]|uniref:HEAT repeat domain-containing protein n=2 Tax=Dyella TaxID=231454 RepID=A0A4R0Z2E4_9GAMM|nr:MULTISPECIES: HEAT repeat domain-containing protein [Dyella]TBR39054.1 HEAT repeat domain-containing protein [Dyella terrae]TCI13356.1 HEAT repeat domain-containing protein [Dyella soli]